MGLLGTAPAWAQNVDDATRRAARNLGAEGVEAYQSGNYAQANERLEKAYRALKVPSLGLWSARALVKVNRVVEAAERYTEVMRLDAKGGDLQVQERAKQEAEAELARLSPQIPNLIVQLEGADPDATQVSIDGVPMVAALIGEKRPVNPGRRVIEAQHAGERVEVEVEVALGETKTALVKLSAARAEDAPAQPAPAPTRSASVEGSATKVDTAPQGSPAKTIGFVTVGLGGAALVVGGIAGAVALGKKAGIDDNPHCKDNQCLKTESESVSSYDTWRTVSSIGLIGGAVLAATGVTLLLTAPRSSQTVALRVAPSSVALQGAF